MDGGTYTLILERVRDGQVTVGALGERRFRRGWYAYTGSAFGPGGFARVDRHRRTARGDHDVRHWHVDYLLGDPETRLADVVRAVGADLECPVARRLGVERCGDAGLHDGNGLDGFGSSDCDCRAHLAVRQTRADLVGDVERAYRAVEEPSGGLRPDGGADRGRTDSA